jgi:hypothetical protein
VNPRVCPATGTERTALLGELLGELGASGN